jgi:hypothetical protein
MPLEEAEGAAEEQRRSEEGDGGEDVEYVGQRSRGARCCIGQGWCSFLGSP